MSSSNPRHTVSIEVTVGVFIAAVFLALCVFTIAISGSAFFKEHQSQIQVVLPDAMGLRRNDLVIARGTAVGVVDKVYYDQDGIHVIAKLDAPVTFHEGYKISVAQTSILGGRQLVVYEGNPESPAVTDTMALTGVAPANLMDDATEVVSKLRDFMQGEFFNNLEKTSANIADISDRLNRGEGTLGKLLSPDESLYNNLNSAILNINSTIIGAREYLDDMRETTPVSTFSSFIFGAF